MSFPENNILNSSLLGVDLNKFLHPLEDVAFKDKDLQVFILRLDELHPEISGNKWFKLKYNLESAKADGYKTILTFGGAYSNHIAATAAAGKLFGFNTIGIIRGEEEKNNSTLEKARADGMNLFFVSRDDYKKKNETEFISQLEKKFGKFHLIPEGGANEWGVKGCTEILSELKTDFDYVCCACGTGTTLAGLTLSLKKDQQALGFSALKGGDFLEEEVKKAAGKNELSANIISDYHFGGYAKIKPELISFMKMFEDKFRISLDNIYTGKMMFGIYDLIGKNYFPQNKTLLVIHSGGLQGNTGFENKAN